MAVAPYLPEGSNTKLFLLVFSLVFFLIAFWLASNPSKLVERIGKVLTPSLLSLIVLLFVLNHYFHFLKSITHIKYQ